MSDQVGSAVAVNNGHLDVHEDDVGFRVRWIGRVGGFQVVEGFFTVPDCGYHEPKFADGFEGYLLIDGTILVLEDWKDEKRGRVRTHLSSTSKILILALSSGDNSSSVGAGGVMLIDLGLRFLL